MKKVIFFLGATALLVVAGGASAFCSQTESPDLFECVSNQCMLSSEFTDSNIGLEATNPPVLYKSTSTPGAACNTPSCPVFTGTPYISFQNSIPLEVPSCCESQ